jgi:hypothetical protein
MRMAMRLRECRAAGHSEAWAADLGRQQMKTYSRIAICLASVLASTACSNKPRTFSATVRPASTFAASQGEGNAYATCDQLVRKGHKGNFASAAATGAAGTAGVAGGAGLAFTSLGGSSWGAAGATATAAMPIIGFAAAFGMNRMIRSGREKSYRKHMSSCLGELGYEVVDWTRMKKKQPGTATLATPAIAAPITPEQAPEVALTTP